MDKKPVATIDEFIGGFPADVQAILLKIRSFIKDLAPGAVEAMAYGIPTFRLNGKNLVHFAAFETHIGFYPTPSGIAAFKDELKPFKSSKGAVQFPLDKPMPYDLIEKMVRFRVAEVGGKSK
jgi:uncharacterized protein YdhG (YjbR/CyaY superfamily)